MTAADVEGAHGLAARILTSEAGQLRTKGTDAEALVTAGGVGVRDVFSFLSPER